MADRLRGIVDTMESLKEDFNKLEDALENIRHVLSLLEDTVNTIESVIHTKTMNEGQQQLYFTTETPTEAVRRIFKECRAEELTTNMIVDSLRSLIKQGRLRIKPGRDPSRFVHSILHNLLKQGFIVKVEDEDADGPKRPQYVLNEW